MNSLVNRVYPKNELLSRCKRVKCIRCNSHRIMRFVDGHGQHRVFCRSCGSSFLDATFGVFVPSGQKNLLGFEAGIYQRPGFIPMR